MQDKTITQRWLSPDSYHESWIERSKLLFNMFYMKEYEKGHDYSISEYGCGYYAPMSKIVEEFENIHPIKYDIKKWDDHTNLCDFNTNDFGVEETDIGALSGVCEYLNSIESTLNTLKCKHKYLLISYAYLPKDSDVNQLSIIKHRANTDGWRNHHSLLEFVKILQNIGVIQDVETWRAQALFLVKCDLSIVPTGR